MVERQRRDHHFLTLTDHRMAMLIELLHVCPNLLHVRHEIAMSEHRALGHTGGTTGVLQHGDVIGLQGCRLVVVAGAVTQHVLEGNGLRQAVIRHHLLQVLDRRVDQRTFQGWQHVADAHFDQVLDGGVGQHLLHVVAEGIEVHQRPRAGILELVPHLPRGVQRVGIDHDESCTQRAEHGDGVLQQVGHLNGNAVAGLQIGVVLQPGGKSGGVALQIGVTEGDTHVAECRAVRVSLAGTLEHFDDRAVST